MKFFRNTVWIIGLLSLSINGSCDNYYDPPESSLGGTRETQEDEESRSEINNDSDTRVANEETEVLKDKAKFDIGCAVNVNYLDDEFTQVYTKTVKENFDRVTAENAMKTKAIWFGVGDYKWGYPDKIRDFALENGFSLHGHVLLWPNSIPTWLEEGSHDSVSFEALVKTYITKVVTRYKSVIKSWDVVNELFENDGQLRENNLVFKLYKDPIAFAGRCFQYARDADPDVKLFYNDFRIALSPEKGQAVLDMVDRFKKEGYPIDGIGIQSHLNTTMDLKEYRKGAHRLASATGLLIHISELDVRMNNRYSDQYVFDLAQKKLQSDFYNEVVSIFEDLPQNQKYGITTWGVSDKRSWRRNDIANEYPLLFDDDFEKKPSYFGFLDALK